MPEVQEANRGEGADTTDSRGVKMERENLRRTLAFAILEELHTHSLTLANVKRYVVPKRTKYRINKEEKITNNDINQALQLIYTVLAQKPIEFRYGRGDVWTARRREAFMSVEISL